MKQILRLLFFSIVFIGAIFLMRPIEHSFMYPIAIVIIGYLSKKIALRLFPTTH